jgi:ribonucleoside-diphosphate reductase alpha chain
MAIAPNANIGLLAGTVPGIDVRFAQAFSRNKFSGKYLDINHNLVHDLERIGIWDKVKEKIIAERGDIENIPEVPEDLKRIYKTSFSVSPYAVIEVAARAQKWVDQALSRNMYLETRDINQILHIYSTAWKKGLKSTYYLHMKPQHSAEQSTVQVNKSEALGRRGFAAMRMAASAPSAVSVASSSGANLGSVEASAHVNPNTSEITVDIEAKVASNPANTGTLEGKSRVINAADFGEDPQAGLVCDSCQ